MLIAFKADRFFRNILTSALLLLGLELILRVFFYLAGRAGMDIGHTVEIVTYIAPFILFLIIVLVLFLIKLTLGLKLIYYERMISRRKQISSIKSLSN